MKRIDWLYDKYHTTPLYHVCFEVIYTYVTEASDDEIVDIETFYRYVIKELSDIWENISSKTNININSDIEVSLKMINSFCKGLSSIISLRTDFVNWLEKEKHLKFA